MKWKQHADFSFKRLCGQRIDFACSGILSDNNIQSDSVVYILGDYRFD